VTTAQHIEKRPRGGGWSRVPVAPSARHFWLPCDPAHRVDCQCKTDEKNIVEPDGYTWTTPVDDSQCRGCEFQGMTGKICPIHGAKT
jgi:hypothetical protein